MKRSSVYSIGFLTIGCLLFGQLGVNFFHTAHDEHKADFDPQSEKVFPHAEHCKVCGIDAFNQHFTIVKVVCILFRTVEVKRPEAVVPVCRMACRYLSGRAPPYRT